MTKWEQFQRDTIVGAVEKSVYELVTELSEPTTAEIDTIKMNIKQLNIWLEKVKQKELADA